MKNFKEYIRYRRTLYLLAITLPYLTLFILYLSNEYKDGLLYAALINLFIIIAFMIVDFVYFLQKKKRLMYILENDVISLDELPEVSHVLEQQYISIAKKMYEAQNLMNAELEIAYTDMIDYFTLWVHQIKTPIFALRLLIKNGDASQAELLTQVLKIEQYVDMVIYYLKVNHMNSDLRIQYYSLKEIVNDVIKKQSTVFIHKKIKLDLYLEDKQILTDEKWFGFVLEQIISNALKYTKDGNISIYEKDDVLYIKDTGMGIKKEDIPRLFEKGFTGYNGRVDKKASGLGLYLSKQILDNLGYKMTIDSTVGIGTIVAIDFHVDKLKVE